MAGSSSRNGSGENYVVPLDEDGGSIISVCVSFAS